MSPAYHAPRSLPRQPHPLSAAGVAHAVGRKGRERTKGQGQVTLRTAVPTRHHPLPPAGRALAAASASRHLLARETRLISLSGWEQGRVVCVVRSAALAAVSCGGRDVRSVEVIDSYSWR